MEYRTFPGKTCFVIMPFGKRIDLTKPADRAAVGLPEHSGAGIAAEPDKAIDFDVVYAKIVKPILEDLKLSFERGDTIMRSGLIHREMMRQIIEADIAIVDITAQNANVFYELGVRHSVKRYTTVLIRREGTQIPFNITGMRVIDYSDAPDKIEFSKKQIKQTIIDSFEGKECDSLVHTLFPSMRVSRGARPIMETQFVDRTILNGVTGAIKNSKKHIGYVTGDIMNVWEIDVWINPENTKMQMARYHDGSVSANIRYFGAKRDHCGAVVKDNISDELDRRKGRASSVEAGTPMMTGPGALWESNRVRKIVHLAGMHGVPGRGYAPIADFGNCLVRALAEIERINSSPFRLLTGSPKLKSIVAPLFGTRSPSTDPQEIAESLFRAAAIFLEREGDDAALEHVYFLAWTKEDQALCEAALASLQREGKIGAEVHKQIGPSANVVVASEAATRNAANGGPAGGVSPPPAIEGLGPAHARRVPTLPARSLPASPAPG